MVPRWSRWDVYLLFVRDDDSSSLLVSVSVGLSSLSTEGLWGRRGSAWRALFLRRAVCQERDDP